MQEALRARLNTLYAAFKLGQIDFILNALHDDIEYVSYAPIKLLPFLGHLRGKSAVAEMLRCSHDFFEYYSMEPVSMVLEGDRAAVILFVRTISRSTGRSVQLPLAQFLRFRDGKIAEIREFMDTYRVAEQLLGRSLMTNA